MKILFIGLVIVAFLSVGAIGKSVPFTNCASGSSIFTVKDFSISPSPPIIGEDATVSVSIDSAEVVTGGSVTVEISGGFIPIKKTFSLCDHNLVNCPIPKGLSSLTLTRKIPSIIPPGTYGFKISATDNSGKNLICASAQMTLKKTSMLSRLLSKLLLRYLTY